MSEQAAQRRNAFDQAIGPALPDWQARPHPPGVTLQGRYCRLEPIDAERHGAQLYRAYAQAPDGRDWTYMMSGPFDDQASYLARARQMQDSRDPLHYSVIDGHSGAALGTLSLMRIDAAHGVIEVGHIVYTPPLQRTPLATEAQYLLAKYVFETLGYRRYEWKCNALNAPSRRAAERYGFAFEGVFRQHLIVKGRNRDTAWFSMLDSEWSVRKAAFERWLAVENFDKDGRQKTSLAALNTAT